MSSRNEAAWQILLRHSGLVTMSVASRHVLDKPDAEDCVIYMRENLCEVDSAILDIELSEGGVFDMTEPMTVQVRYGQVTVEPADCNAALLSYDIPSIRAKGEIPIERMALVILCNCE